MRIPGRGCALRRAGARQPSSGAPEPQRGLDAAPARPECCRGRGIGAGAPDPRRSEPRRGARTADHPGTPSRAGAQFVTPTEAPEEPPETVADLIAQLKSGDSSALE